MMKECTHCHEVKPLSEFYRRKDGELESWCKKCKTEAAVKWNKEHKYRHKIHVIKYKENKEKYHKTLAEKQTFKEIIDFSRDVLGGYKIYILNHKKAGERKYNIIRTDGKTFCTNDKIEFLNFLENI